MVKYDVVVVGGGPAGLSTAKTCSDLGVNTLLVEKDSPTEKKKSWLVYPEALEIFDLHHCVVNKIKYDLYNHFDKKVKIGDGSVRRFVINQPAFTNEMLSESSFDTRFNCEVAWVERVENKGFTLLMRGGEKLSAKLVIDATGFESRIIKMLGLPVTRKRGHISYGNTLDLSPKVFGIDRDTAIHEEVVVDTCFGKRLGELWVYPISNSRVEVGLGFYIVRGDLDEINLGAKKEGMEDYTTRIVRPVFEFILERDFNIKLKGIDIRDRFFGPGGTVAQRTMSSDNFLAVGESVGQVQETYLYGFYLALYFGKIAGEVVAEAIRRREFDKFYLSLYDTLCKKKQCKSNSYSPSLREIGMIGQERWGYDMYDILIDSFKDVHKYLGYKSIDAILNEEKLRKGLNFNLVLTIPFALKNLVSYTWKNYIKPLI